MINDYPIRSLIAMSICPIYPLLVNKTNLDVNVSHNYIHKLRSC